MIVKRDGTKVEFEVEKIHAVIGRAIEGLDGVSLSDIEFNANLSIKDGISTRDIHNILIRSANDLISESTPNYQYVSARLLLYSLRKEVWGGSQPPRLYEHIKSCADAGVYDADVLSKYTESEIHKINKYIKHERDKNFVYCGLQQLVDKYLIKNRRTGKIYETPQFAYMLICMTLLSQYKGSRRLNLIKKAYDYISTFKISLPTPIMSGVRTNIKQYASCCLIDVDDSMHSIFSSNAAVGYYTSQRSGIGINVGRIRPIGEPIRDGEVIHTGIIPFLKVFEASVKSCQQNGLRGGCFDKNTLVIIKRDNLVQTVKISNVVVGDEILSYDGKNNLFKQVKSVFRPVIAAENQVIISTKRSTFICSLSHRMDTPDGYKTAYTLMEEGKEKQVYLMNQDRNPIMINSMFICGEFDEEFYDLEVEETSCFYICSISPDGRTGNELLLSHNSATVYAPFWHYEIEDIIGLKNNSKTEDNSVKKLDYTVQFSKLFYDRVIKNEDITLFSSHECKDLYEFFGTDKFDEEYIKQENNTNLKMVRRIPARRLAEQFCRESLETGRIYMMNIDHCNTNSSWNLPVKMSNLCLEILQFTKPITHIDDPEGEIGICILSAINVLETKIEEYPEVCDIVVRLLDSLIDLQNYPVKAAENFTKNRRSLGVGITNFAALAASQKMLYGQKESWYLMDEIAENLQFSLLNASANLAEEFGRCSKYEDTTYARGILPIDRYNKNVDSICDRPHSCDWEGLRKRIADVGLRHSTLTCQMPVESTSVIQGSTNGIEPPRSLLSFRKSKQGLLKQLVPNFQKMKNWYVLAFNMDGNTGYFNIVATMQKWIDMSISANRYYNYANYPDGNIPLSVMLKDMLYMYKMGIKTLYYTNSPDGDDETKQTSGCESGACAI